MFLHGLLNTCANTLERMEMSNRGKGRWHSFPWCCHPCVCPPCCTQGTGWRWSSPAYSMAWWQGGWSFFSRVCWIWNKTKGWFWASYSTL